MITIATNFLHFLAQTPAPSAGGAAGTSQSPLGNMMVPLIGVMAIFMFFSFNSKRKADKQHKLLLSQMKRGDRVRTIGGILGTIVEVRDSEVVVKVDESNNTKLKFTRSAIATIVTEEEKVEAK